MRNGWVQPVGALAMILGLAGSAAAGVAQRPLLLDNATEPNIMFLLDSSASMKHIVAESGVTAPACNAATPISNGTVILADNDNGTVKIGQGDRNNTTLWAAAGNCFDPALSYQAALRTDLGTGLPGQYSGAYLNWYFGDNPTGWSSADQQKPGTQQRIEVAQATLKALLPSLSGNRVGLAQFNGTTGALIEAGVASISSSYIATLNGKIDAIGANVSGTPLAESLHQLGRYFVGHAGINSPGHSSSASCSVNGQYDGNLAPPGLLLAVDDDTLLPTQPAYAADVASQESPICHHCQKNFAILLTDGEPTQDLNIPTPLQDYDGDCNDVASGCSPTRSYPSNGSDYLDDVAQALFETDLRPDIDNPVTSSEVVNNLATYTIGFADQSATQSLLLRETASQGGGLFVAANDTNALVAALRGAVNDIAGQVSNASAVAISSTNLQTNTIAFQALFSSVDWSGQLLARPISSSGALSAAAWNAADSSSYPALAQRTVLSWDAVNDTGYSFTSAALSIINANSARVSGATLSSQQVDYLRGERSNESPNGLGFRARSSLLGDIVNSDPLFVGRSNFGNSRLAGAEGEDYLDFLADPSVSSRSDMVYVGANDGMLHGYAINFDVASGTVSGVEQLAYIPTAALGRIDELTSPGYTHNFFVDGSPQFSDAYLQLGGGPAEWRTVLVGTTGAGGSGVFALDITDPSSFGAANVLWDINATSSGFGDLGFTIGEASIARFQDGNWYAVFGNGYESTSGFAKLYMVQLDNRANVRVFDTGVGAGNGMSSPLVVDRNGDRIADAIYAGDLKGNLWKVDVSNDTATNWALVDYDASNGSLLDPLFRAVDASGASQSITAKPQAAKHPLGGVVVLFGTGQFFDDADNDVVADPQVQSFYGIHDDGGSTAVTRADLGEQTIILEQDFPATGLAVRGTSANAAGARGWFMELRSPVNGAEGERVVDTAIIRGDRVVFTSLIPDPTPCSSGGVSWLMELALQSGSRLSVTPFDVNGDGLFNDQDFVLDSNGNPIPVSGVQDVSLGVIGGVSVLATGGAERKILTGSTGVDNFIDETVSGQRGRQSWQQLK